MTTLTTLRGVALRRFIGHYLQMLVAMVVGMAALGPLESLLLNPLGWAELRSHPEISALIMATNMNWLIDNGHPKWKSVKLDYPLKGWEQYDCVRKYLGRTGTVAAPAKPAEANPVQEAIRNILRDQ